MLLDAAEASNGGVLSRDCWIPSQEIPLKGCFSSQEIRPQ